MKRLLFYLISFCAMQTAWAQEEISFDSIPKSQIWHDYNELSIEMPLNFDHSFDLEGLNLMDEALFHQPLLPDYIKLLDFKKYISGKSLQTETYVGFGNVYSPYLNGVVFNQASYQLNDDFSFGGSSFGAQSIFETPKINSSIQDMSVKGASMFMEYKFSNNFKVQTQVSISNGRSFREP